MKLLVTGGLGFIGSNFINLLQEENEYSIVNIDKMTYAAKFENVSITKPENYEFVKADINDESTLEKYSDIDWVINFAAESHVDNSIKSSTEFVQSNVQGVRSLLDFCRKHDKMILQISTDEVYGSIEKGSFTEESPLNPRNPYSATKASAELLVKAYHETYGIPYLITRGANNYGPNQHPEKLIPKTISNILSNKKTPVYGRGLQIRNWVYVKDHCNAIKLVLERGIKNQDYNIPGPEETSNISLVKLILKTFNKPESLIDFVPDRLGHDFRYSMGDSKIRKLGFSYSMTLEKYLHSLV
ncbi:GDP-mannose 4,6-dehydratase [uncultured archaeon]|nr:GDP-mannose 4,6-dehydratase [uncultured archaeon]